MEPHEVDDILRTLVRIAASQDLINEHQRTINDRLAVAIEGLAVTQARIETLLARMIAQGENGREA